MPAGTLKKELLDYVDQIPTYVQQLQFTVKNPTVGKAATFTKVDAVIQETKNCMNCVSKVVSTCFECANKVIVHFALNSSLFIIVQICGILLIAVHLVNDLYDDDDYVFNIFETQTPLNDTVVVGRIFSSSIFNSSIFVFFNGRERNKRKTFDNSRISSRRTYFLQISV